MGGAARVSEEVNAHTVLLGAIFLGATTQGSATMYASHPG